MPNYRKLTVSHPVTGIRFQIQTHVFMWLLSNGLWQKGIIEIERGMIVHHKDFNRQNNDPSNLMLMTYSEHGKLHWEHDTERRKRVSEALKQNYATQTPEQRKARIEKAQKASAEKVRREGPSLGQIEGLKKARAAAYGGSRANPKELTQAEIEEIKITYPLIKGKPGRVEQLCREIGISRRRLCRIANACK
jgi:hypothetical protein